MWYVELNAGYVQYVLTFFPTLNVTTSVNNVAYAKPLDLYSWIWIGRPCHIRD